MEDAHVWLAAEAESSFVGEAAFFDDAFGTFVERVVVCGDELCVKIFESVGYDRLRGLRHVAVPPEVFGHGISKRLGLREGAFRILREADSADDFVQVRQDDGPVVICSLKVVFDDIEAVRTCAMRLPTGVWADVGRGGVFEEVVGVREIPWTDDGSGCDEGFHG